MTQETQQVEVKANAAGYPALYVDGQNIGQYCTKAVITLEGGGRLANVELTLLPDVVDVDVAALVSVIRNAT